MIRAITFLCLLSAALNTQGGDPKYPVSAIPEALRTNVNVVFREDHMTFRIHSKSKASYFVHQVITILRALRHEAIGFIRQLFFDGKTFVGESVGGALMQAPHSSQSVESDDQGARHGAFRLQAGQARHEEIGM